MFSFSILVFYIITLFYSIFVLVYMLYKLHQCISNCRIILQTCLCLFVCDIVSCCISFQYLNLRSNSKDTVQFPVQIEVADDNQFLNDLLKHKASSINDSADMSDSKIQ